MKREEIKETELHRAFPSITERVGWSSRATISWPAIRGATAKQLYITILYLAQSFHYSLSTLLSRVISAGRKVKTGEIGRKEEQQTEEGKKRRAGERVSSLVVLHCCHGDTRRPELERADSCHGTADCHGWQLSVNHAE